MNEIKYMTGIEYQIFENSDERKYILKENKEFLKIYDKIISDGVYIPLTLNQMQEMMNQIIVFFEFKYPKQMFEDSTMRNYNYELMARRLGKVKDLAEKLDINQLKYRLHHDMVQFLKCSYGTHCRIEKDVSNLSELSFCMFRIQFNGTINPYDKDDLQHFVKMKDICDVEQLYGMLESNVSNIDYSDLTEIIKRHKAKTTLRNQVLQLIPLQMIYRDPIYGYYRAKSYIRMFNKKYNLELNLDEAEEILQRDYSETQIEETVEVQKTKRIFLKR